MTVRGNEEATYTIDPATVGSGSRPTLLATVFNCLKFAVQWKPLVDDAKRMGVENFETRHNDF